MFPTEGSPNTFGLMAEVDGTVIGFAIWFHTFSTWTGRNGIWLEDLFVDPEYRGYGAGKALLGRLAQICRDRGLTRLEWCVLTWNTPSIGFYESLGDRKSTRLNSSHVANAYAVFCLNKKSADRVGAYPDSDRFCIRLRTNV